jgi:hypothetical protein
VGEIVLDHPLAGRVEIERLVVGSLDDLHDILRCSLVFETYLDQYRLRGVRRRLVDDVHDSRRPAEPVHDLVDLRLEARLIHAQRFRADEHDVARVVAGSCGQPLAQQVVRLHRLGVVQLFRFAGQRVAEEEDDQAERNEDGGDPGADGAPGMTGRSCGQTPRH